MVKDEIDNEKRKPSKVSIVDGVMAVEKDEEV